MHRPHNAKKDSINPEKLLFPENADIALNMKNHFVVSHTYPQTTNDKALAAILLDRDNSERNKLILPDNFITLGQVLNDALSSWSGKESRSKGVASGVLRLVGARVGEAIDSSGYAPEELSYEQVIYSRDNEEIKLMPPLTLVECDDPETAKHNLTRRFIGECITKAANQPQLEQFLQVAGSLVDGINTKAE